MRRVALFVGLLLFVPKLARAEQQCLTSVDEFNTFMDAQISSASTAVLSFTVTGVDLNDYFNGKGWLCEMVDTRCTAGGAGASLKVYGNSDPLNTAHPPGTLKLEYGSACCATAPCPVEYWADPMPGDPVFTLPSQVCAVTESVTPTTLSYDVQCDGGTLYHAEGANHDAMMITRAAVLAEVTGGHPMTNATASNVKICFELAGAPVGSQTVPVMQDVTVAPQYPTSVYPDVNDLACGASDGTVYLKFDLSQVQGSIKAATLYVHSGTDSSSTGTGADVDAVADTSWSENTLTWNARPALGTNLGRIEGVTPDRWYTIDVTSAVSGPATYSFALAPRATDTDTAHFISKEASSTLRPYLLLNVLAGDSGLGGSGGTGGSDAAAGTGGGWTSSGGAPTKADGGIDPNVQNDESSSGCGCGVVERRPTGLLALLSALALVGLRRTVRRVRITRN